MLMSVSQSFETVLILFHPQQGLWFDEIYCKLLEGKDHKWNVNLFGITNFSSYVVSEIELGVTRH